MWNRKGWDYQCNLDFDQPQAEAVLSGESQALPLPLASRGHTKHCLHPPVSPAFEFATSAPTSVPKTAL